MGQYVQNVPVKFQKNTVFVGTPVYLDTQSFPYPLSVVVVPGATGSMLVEFSLTPNAAGLGASATWIAWPLSTVSATTYDYLKSPVSALRFTATGANGAYEVAA